MRSLTTASGILMVATGAFCFINPGQTFMTMAFVIGAVMVVCGLIHCFAYILARQTMGRGDNNGWIGVDATVTLLLGILVLANQLTADIAIPMIFGMWMLISGILRIEAASRIDRHKKTRNFRATMLTGLATIIVGLFGFVNPLATYVSAVTLLGIFMLMQGINSVELGINMPHERSEVVVTYKRPSKGAVIIGDDSNESYEDVQKRIMAQKEEARENEFNKALAMEDIGLTREETEQVKKEIIK